MATLLGAACGDPAADGAGKGDADVPPPPTDDDAGVDPPVDAAPPPTDECGDVRLLSNVYFGTELPTYVTLTPGQIMAIGSWGGCSGTLIAPTWVLTAKHCGLQAGADFCMGVEADDPNRCISTVRVVNHPDRDTTLAELERDARDVLPGVEPIPIMTTPLDSSWIGRMAEGAGYGQQENGNSGEREFTAEPIVRLEADFVTVDGQGVHGLCFGDSGGPLLVMAADGVRVEGDLTGGDGNCVGEDNYTRVDVSVEWIESYTGPTPGTTGCGAIDSVGRCLSGSAVYCGPDEQLVTTRCDEACGWDAAAMGYRCVGDENPCADLDALGRCDGDTARWCDQGAPRARDCGGCDQKCELVAGVGATCVEDPCMGLDYQGRCVGTVAEWCDNGQLARQDCADSGQTCAYIDENIGYYCVD